jgi:hypothetical protein
MEQPEAIPERPGERPYLADCTDGGRKLPLPLEQSSSLAPVFGNVA